MSPHELVFDIFFGLFCYGLRVLAKFKVTDYIFVIVMMHSFCNSSTKCLVTKKKKKYYCLYFTEFSRFPGYNCKAINYKPSWVCRSVAAASRSQAVIVWRWVDSHQAT